MTGGAGADTFSFSYGTTRVRDFEVGRDRIDIRDKVFDDVYGTGTDLPGRDAPGFERAALKAFWDAFATARDGRTRFEIEAEDAVMILQGVELTFDDFASAAIIDL